MPTCCTRPGCGASRTCAGLSARSSAPVNVLALPGSPSVAELAAAGVARISVGGAFSHVAFGALTRAARELLDDGTLGFMELAGEGARQERAAFGA